MSLWRHLTRGLGALARRRAAEADLADEVRHYLEEATAAHEARGLAPDQARRAARRELGSASGIAEQVRSYGWENAVAATAADLRYGARRLGRDAAFTALCTLTVALGIGATTTIFGAIHPILVEPLPYPEAGRVVTLWEVTDDGSRLEGTYAAYRALVERSRSFETLAVTRPWQPTVAGGTEPERLEGQRVTAGYFRVLGVAPALGRDFAASEDGPQATRVVILSHRLWQRRFGGDAAILGRQVHLGDDPYEVVGVMPRELENVLAPAATLWTPLRYDLSLPQAWGHHLRTVGRLRPGVGTAEAERELAALVPVLRRELPEANVATRMLVTSLQADVTRDVRPAILAVAVGVALLLAIACVNVASLVVARGAQRRGELALRVALGAGRARVVRQLLAESFLLAMLGGGLGIGVAVVGIRVLVAASPAGLPRVEAIAVDGAVLAFAVAVTTFVGLAFGLAPALRATGRDLQPVLGQRSPRIAGSRRTARGRLVIAEVAIAVVLLVGTGLLLRSLQRLLAVPVGFEPDGVSSLQVQAAGHRYDDDEATRAFFAAALEAVRGLPGVTAAGWTSQLPFSGDDETWGVQFAADAPGNGNSAYRYAVSPGYFDALRIPLLSGRSLAASDRRGSPPAALLGESFARRRFGVAAAAVGQRLRIGAADGPWFTVVGVVGDVRQTSLATGVEDAVYVTTDQWHFADSALSLVVRASGDPAALAPALRRAVWSVDDGQPIVRVASMADLVAASAAQRRFTMGLFAVFAAAALVLAATGIYGVLSGGVAERRREIGVRCALGASRSGIVGAVLRQGMRLSSAGALIGLAVAATASGTLTALLFGVSPLDPLTYLGVGVLLLAVAAVAACAPAWRAARVDPVIALRE